MKQRSTDTKILLPPPSFTTSCSLLLGSLLLLGLVGGSYFFWYLGLTPRKAGGEKKIVTVGKQEELNEAIARAEEGTVLLVSAGTREGNFRMLAKVGLTLRYQGIAGQGILHTNSAPVLELRDCRDCVIEGFVLQSDAAEEGAVRLVHVTNVRLSACEIRAAGVGVYAEARSVGVHLSGNRLEVGKNGIAVHDGQEILLQKNTITLLENPANGPAILLHQVKGLQVSENTLQGKAGGLWLRAVQGGNPPWQRIEGNRLETPKAEGMLLEETSDITLRGNEITYGEGIGLHLVQSRRIHGGAPLDKSVAEGDPNKIKGSRGEALRLVNAAEVVLHGNWLSNGDSDKTAVYLQDCRAIRLVRNEISGEATFEKGTQVLTQIKGGGVRAQYAREVRFQGNRIYQSLSFGLRAEKNSSVELVENQFQQNWGNAIEIEDSEAQIGPGNVIEANNRGIAARSSQGKILQNTISKNQNYGISLTRSSFEITDNRLESNYGHGICLEQNSQATLLRNQFMGNQGFGIHLLQPGTIDWKSNTYDKNQLGACNRP